MATYTSAPKAPPLTQEQKDQLAKAPVSPFSGTDASTWPGFKDSDANPANASRPGTTAPSNALDILFASMPWMRQIGITKEQLQAWAAQGITGEALYGEIIQTPQYQAFFPAIRRQDGTLRMSEAQYLARQDDFRQLFNQYGIQGDFGSAQLAHLFNLELDPNELKQRLDVYDNVKRGSQDIKDAFYVYAGLKPTTDDLYMATVDPQFRAQLNQAYTQAVTTTPPDYPTFITRATEAGLNRVARAVSPPPVGGIPFGFSGGGMGGALGLSPTPAEQEQYGWAAIENSRTPVYPGGPGGVLTTDQSKAWVPPAGATVPTAADLSKIDPAVARQVADLLYHGGDPTGTTTKFLNLQELLHSFELAMIGSAATQSGLQLPDLQRVQAIRDAGISRTQALQAYSQFGQQQGLLAGEATRAGSTGFNQSDFEQAVLLHQAPSEAELSRIQAQEKGLGHAQGSADITTSETGAVVQRGLRGQT